MKCSPFPWNGNSSSRNSVLVLWLGLTSPPPPAQGKNVSSGEAQGKVGNKQGSIYRSRGQPHFEAECGCCGKMEKRSRPVSLSQGTSCSGQTLRRIGNSLKPPGMFPVACAGRGMVAWSALLVLNRSWCLGLEARSAPWMAMEGTAFPSLSFLSAS